MAREQLYKSHLIVSSADFDAAAEDWILGVTIGWKRHGRPKLHTLKSLRERFRSKEDAEAFAVDTGKAWVDDHVRLRTVR
jgi:hypothetical protein